MRKAFPVLLAVLAAVPGIALAAPPAGASDGALSVAAGRGEIALGNRGGGMVGGVIGRFDRGCVSITDLTQEDPNFPLVWGDDEPQVDLPRGGVRYCGVAVRFRLIGGKFRLTVSGRGIDLSAVGVGTGTLVATDARLPGVYSLDGDDCRAPRAVCKPLPTELTAFKLGTQPGDKAEKNAQRGGSD